MQNRTNENMIGTNEPTAAPPSTNEPTATKRTDETVRGTDRPRHAVPPLPETRTDEPDDLPAPSLNRHQRRRLTALARRGLRPAA
jgi:hypothetical protein